jgi:hypothetical protein
MTVLVCGGRNFNNPTALYAVLDRLHAEQPITRIVHGAASGADSLGEIWGMMRGVFAAGYKAQWDAYGKGAGFIRNQEMLDVEKPDLVVACPGGNGTADMVRRATKAGVKIVTLEEPA